MSVGYLVLELRRTLRSTRFLIFTIVFPVVLFLLDTGLAMKRMARTGNDPSQWIYEHHIDWDEPVRGSS